MDKCLALLAFLFSLSGCEPTGSTFVSREVSNGRDLLHARASLASGVARFECLRSDSGLCHWTIHPARCGDGAPCATPPQRIVLAADESRQLAGVTRLRACVARRAGGSPACEVLGADAAGAAPAQ